MPQLSWSLTTAGRQHQLGLYHGDESGHVVVHCNGQVMLIDFAVKESKTFSFFIEEELCEMAIIRQDGGFAYSCRLNEEAATPINLYRKAQRQRQGRRMRWGAGVVVALALVVGWLALRAARWENGQWMDELRAGGGELTTVRLLHDSTSGRWRCAYQANGQALIEVLRWPADTLAPTGWPLAHGDEFVLHYLPQRPTFKWIDLGAPADKSLARYFLLAAGQHTQLHPELSPRQAHCQTRLAQRLQGAQALAALYYQNHTPAQRQAYLRLVRSPEFVEGARDCL